VSYLGEICSPGANPWRLSVLKSLSAGSLSAKIPRSRPVKKPPKPIERVGHKNLAAQAA
jgi:hypothetical protein